MRRESEIDAWAYATRQPTVAVSAGFWVRVSIRMRLGFLPIHYFSGSLAVLFETG